MTTESFKTTVIRAAEGHFLTQSADVDIRERMVVSVIALGANDSADNYREITNAEAEEIREQQREAMKEDRPND